MRENFVFHQLINHSIFCCENKKCGHFWLPDPKKGQGIHSRNDDLKIESDEIVYLRDHRVKLV